MVTPTQIDSEHALLAAIGPPLHGGQAIALIGGADNLVAAARARIAPFFRTLAEALDAAHAVLVDGGTESGVMRLVADARRETGATFRLIGVVPRGRIGRPTRGGTVVALAEGHTELLLVPGTKFGDESPWLFRAADHLAGGHASTLVVNGGRLSLGEAVRRLAAGAPVAAVEGSGRAADALARALAAGGVFGVPAVPEVDDQLRPFPAQPVDIARLRVIGLDAGVGDLAVALRATLEEDQRT